VLAAAIRGYPSSGQSQPRHLAQAHQPAKGAERPARLRLRGDDALVEIFQESHVVQFGDRETLGADEHRVVVEKSVDQRDGGRRAQSLTKTEGQRAEANHERRTLVALRVRIAVPRRQVHMMTVKAVATVDVPPGRALELWMLPDGRAPVSMGLVATTGIERLALRAPAGVALQDIPALAVSIEPAGGSPTGAPTGPVILTGRVERIF